MTWDIVKISEKPIHVENIIIEPTNTAEKFIIYGTTSAEDGKKTKGIVIALDFSTLHERECQHPETPGTQISDYETWSPNGHISEHCLMGHQTTYIRRKRDVQCYNKEEFDRWLEYKNCECTEEDWECDLGYERKDEGPCVLVSGDKPSYTPPEVCDGYYTVTRGYRKVAGNTCQGGVDHSGIVLSCPGMLWQKSIIVIALVIVGAAIYAFFRGGNVEKAKGLIQDFGNAASKRAKSYTNQFQIIKNVDDDNNDEDEEDFDNEGYEHTVKIDNIQEQEKPQEQQGKRMTKRDGLETASKHIPALSGPGQRIQHDEDEDDLSGFDPRS